WRNEVRAVRRYGAITTAVRAKGRVFRVHVGPKMRPFYPPRMGAGAKKKKEKERLKSSVPVVADTKDVAHLTKPERALLSEALRRADETRNRMEASLVEL